jgi:protein transport protein SEC31
MSVTYMNYFVFLLRFHKLVWGGTSSDEDWSSGIIAGGCDNGVIRLYNASKLAKNVDSVVAKSDRHVGSVKALNFNLFQVIILYIFTC